jgi:uncharacterized protein
MTDTVGGTMRESQDDLLRQMVDVIVREVDPETIILFGSRGRGGARADSDVDLLVVEREPFGPGHSRLAETNRLYIALRGIPIAKDLLLYSREEVEHWKDSLNHVIGRAYREGQIIHGRS